MVYQTNAKREMDRADKINSGEQSLFDRAPSDKALCQRIIDDSGSDHAINLCGELNLLNRQP